MAYCTNCGNSIVDNAKFCEECGAALVFDTKPSHIPIMTLDQSKSMGIAAFLAVVPALFGFWGIGHFYLGKIIRGTFFLCIGFIFSAIAFFASFIITIVIGSLEITLIGYDYEDFERFLAIITIACIISGLFYLWQCIDACRLAQKWNKALGETGQKPW